MVKYYVADIPRGPGFLVKFLAERDDEIGDPVSEPKRIISPGPGSKMIIAIVLKWGCPKTDGASTACSLSPCLNGPPWNCLLFNVLLTNTSTELRGLILFVT